MKWKDIVQKIVLFCKIYLYVPETLPKMPWLFVKKLWAWRGSEQLRPEVMTSPRPCESKPKICGYSEICLL